ncbi:Isochorismatase hydrolase [Westerdykella ornata]|uniref:Isochorismatase hydrolase n=1 Tax=Westerdykella ornata TaxID=318751 RepID=A0A6A6JGK1_WESOR|nr:Isochorismatase hydrolase [Westerdykella ornata]KAF2275395.1 Isochorismatase hydrolase [Westerdykella ornata]
MKTALLVIDMQEHFREMGMPIMKNISTLSDHFTTHYLPQHFTQHGHPPSDFESPITNQLVKKWGIEGSIHRGSPAWHLLPSIRALYDNASSSHTHPSVIPKNTYDAFLGITGPELSTSNAASSSSSPPAPPSLESRLRTAAVERVIVCGVLTDCCCDTTARSAFNRGFETWLVEDACASVDQRQHEAALRGYGFGYGDVVSTEEVVRRLGREVGC